MNGSALVDCLDVLRCPVSGEPLTLLSESALRDLNAQLQAETWRHRDGSPARYAVTAALGATHGQYVYRVEEDIAWLLPGLALVPQAGVTRTPLEAEKKLVQSFYDEFGWTRSESGLFKDTEAFTDGRRVAQDYRQYCNRRIARLLPGGRFLLDVASGAIPHPEYLDFSRDYAVRICVDFSIRALREARLKLGGRGLYLLGDITRLPLASDSIDTVISLHTIYHVPQTQQTSAVDEITRVTKPGGRVVVVYTWGSSVAMAAAFRLRGMLGWVRRCLRFSRTPAPGVGAPSPDTPPSLYFQPQNYDWFARDIAARHKARLRVWGALSTSFQVRFLSEGTRGRWLLAAVKYGENCFPWLAGRFGQYPMFVIDKPPC
ncbi:MAG TPA: class I SAM-dependent methyltransferase [Opitutaceae bacterium]|nr:class I SAM-dependent methyltransferase [Opitutaceae bacterium]